MFMVIIDLQIFGHADEDALFSFGKFVKKDRFLTFFASRSAFVV
jgi:hypothetical protein